MKILGKQDSRNIRSAVAQGYGPYYTVQSPRGDKTAIDKDGNIVDFFHNCSIRYTLPEAEELVAKLKETFPDYSLDPYYKQGKPIYPIFQYPHNFNQFEKYRYNNFIIYRYKVSGEWIYGFTNRGVDVPNCTGKNIKAMEAPMDGWDKWVKDRKQMLKDKELAETIGNL